MSVARVTLTLNEELLSKINLLARKYKLSRSSFISKALDANVKSLVAEEVANSYNHVFADEDIRQQQKNWAEKLIVSSDNF